MPWYLSAEVKKHRVNGVLLAVDRIAKVGCKVDHQFPPHHHHHPHTGTDRPTGRMRLTVTVDDRICQTLHTTVRPSARPSANHPSQGKHSICLICPSSTVTPGSHGYQPTSIRASNRVVIMPERAPSERTSCIRYFSLSFFWPFRGQSQCDI